jgi:hypothetical protein
MSPNRDTYAKAIGEAVRSETSRRGQPLSALVPVLGLSRTTVYGRVKGREPFDYVELQRIADFLDIPLMQIIDSAELSLRAAA